eukprot:1349890-Alexandrium_andersonii.AAC.1
MELHLKTENSSTPLQVDRSERFLKDRQFWWAGRVISHARTPARQEPCRRPPAPTGSLLSRRKLL